MGPIKVQSVENKSVWILENEELKKIPMSTIQLHKKGTEQDTDLTQMDQQTSGDQTQEKTIEGVKTRSMTWDKQKDSIAAFWTKLDDTVDLGEEISFYNV